MRGQSSAEGAEGSACPAEKAGGKKTVPAQALLAAGTPSSLSGLAAALGAYLLWGILPVFWKGLSSVDSLEVLCHRIFWSFVMLAPFMFFQNRLGSLLVFLRSPRNFFGLLLSAFLLAGNWFLYIWAIASDMIMETSLGYYINPLVNILFGMVFFREKISRPVAASIAIAVTGVLYQVVALGHLPLVPLGLAFSFGLYALIRKMLMVQALPGLFMETLVVLPLAAGYLFRQASLGCSAFFRNDPVIDFLLVGAGVITTVPMLLFVCGARRIRMTTLGLAQYINPTCVFLLAVFVYDEAVTPGDMVTFFCIWTALALYTWDTVRSRRW
jgi:chloramphenicol-sensitive protein RarD